MASSTKNGTTPPSLRQLRLGENGITTAKAKALGLPAVVVDGILVLDIRGYELPLLVDLVLHEDALLLVMRERRDNFVEDSCERMSEMAINAGCRQVDDGKKE